MNERQDQSDGATKPLELPTPHFRHSHYPTLVIWIVPLLAALGATFYLYRFYQDRGPEITIRFHDTSGIRTHESPLTVHGVKVGTVTEVDLSSDARDAVVHVQMQRKAISVAKETSIFWMVRPDVVGGTVSGLGTVISGPYIECIVGEGPDRRDFIGSDTPPLMVGSGTRVILHSPRIEHIQLATPVYYRGVQVGQVQDVRLGSDSTTVNLTLFIQSPFSALVRSDSKFWSMGVATVKGDLIGGIELHVGSPRAILGGGIAFATPDGSSDKNASVAAIDGTEFELFDQPKKEWLDWSARIELPTQAQAGTGGSAVINAEPSGLRSAVRVK